MENVLKSKKAWFLGILGLFSVMMVFGSYYIVHEGEVGVVKTLGKYDKGSTDPGVNWKLPFLQSVTMVDTKLISVNYRGDRDAEDQRFVINLPRYTMNDTNNVAVNIEFNIQLRVNGKSAAHLLRVYGKRYYFNGLAPIVDSSVRTVIGTRKFEDINKNRSLVAIGILAKLKQKIKALPKKDAIPVHIVAFNLRNVFANDPNVKRRIALVQAAKQKSEQAKQDQERKRTEADTKKIQLVTKAEAQRLQQNKIADAKLYEKQQQAKAIQEIATANAFAIKVKAISEAKAIQIIRTSLCGSATKCPSSLIVQWKTANKWSGTLPRVVMGKSSGTLLSLPIGK